MNLWRFPFMNKKRFFFKSSLAVLAAFGVTERWLGIAHAEGKHFEITHTEEEWRKLLTPDQFEVLRNNGTERAYTSPLLKEHRRGLFHCAGCQLALFSSDTKFESGTGWPSFWAPLDKAIDTEHDQTFGMSRTAVTCHRCGGHLGHVFDDGPKPTGLRYCMNGVALQFKPQAS
jgi:peptide-methionine (R)-S-oxide reductase